jgi:hypothetical protein
MAEIINQKPEAGSQTGPPTGAALIAKQEVLPLKAIGSSKPSHHPRLTIITLLAILLTATIVHARVFTLRKGRNDTVGTLARLGGRVAYNADITINGGSGHLSVIGFKDPLNNTIPNICRTLNIPTDSSNIPDQIDPNTFLYILKSQTKTLRLILINLPEKQSLLAIAIEQTNTEYEKSSHPPNQHQLKAIPAYPDSSPEFYAENNETKLAIAVSSTSAPAEAISSFYHITLKSDGWKPYLSDANGSISKMTIYQRNSEICCILATSSQKLILLHKQLN